MGIGRATALRLNRRGWRVFGSIRMPEDGQALVAAATYPDRMVPVRWDVLSDDDTAAAVDTVRAAIPAGEGLDGYSSNAGIAALSGDVWAEGTPLQGLDRLVQVNYLGAVRGMQAFLPHLRASGGVLVVNSELQPHLDHEEADIVPLAAVTLTQQEWNSLGDKAREAIPKERMGMAFGMLLEPLDDSDRAFMKSHLPLPVRLLSPVLIDRPWRKYAETLRHGT